MYDDLIKRHGLRSEVGILFGWNWLSENEHNLDGWQPKFEIQSGGVRHTINVRNPKIIRKLVKTI